MTQHLFPDLPGFSIEQITLVDNGVTIIAQSQTRSASCPDCASVSSRVHSRYSRQLADLPWSGRRVRLILEVRRFFCKQLTCPRKTFAEAIPAVAERYARRTLRLTEVLEHLGLALGGEPASRQTAILGMHCSPDTLLRLLRRLPDGPIEPPRVVSLDDWAWRRGHRYGTIICDLERHCPIDLLPERNAASVSAWLKRYPSIEIISRDGSDIYAQGAKLGAPQATQVTDKWHLLKNLGEALQRLLARHLALHRKRQESLASKAQEKREEQDPLIKRPGNVPAKLAAIQQAREEEHFTQYQQALALREQGLSHQAIADRIGKGHSTVQRWLEEGAFPKRKPREQASQLDPYLPYIRQRRMEGCYNMVQLHREVREKGYKGSYSAMKNIMDRIFPKERKWQRLPTLQGTEQSLPLPSRQATWLFLRQPDKLTAEEKEAIAQLCQIHEEVVFAYQLVQQFAQMLRNRQGEHLTDWLSAAQNSPLADLYPFVKGVISDKAAVQAGLTLPWSQGQTEGQITRLKLIKRQGYGRARFDLLRKRVLHAA